MVRQANEGNPVEALKAFSSALGNMAQAAVGESRTTHHRVKSRYEDAYDRIVHVLGFRNVKESENGFIVNYEYEQKKKRAEERKRTRSSPTLTIHPPAYRWRKRYDGTKEFFS